MFVLAWLGSDRGKCEVGWAGTVGVVEVEWINDAEI